MTLVDLSLPISTELKSRELIRVREHPLKCGDVSYTGMEYLFNHDSMVGTYIDFPGHIKETDDGTDAENYPLERLFSIKTAVIHLDRESGSGAVEANELKDACPDTAGCGAIILNALGTRRFDEIKNRSVWISKEAVQWLISTGIHLFVSDIYEREPELIGVFSDLFGAKISTVCCPINLSKLTTPYVNLTVLTERYETVTQLPCRAIAELIEE